jgi:hypothetical protein
MVNVYGVTVGDAAGVKPGASLVDRTPVNVGTIRVRSSLFLGQGKSGFG